MLLAWQGDVQADRATSHIKGSPIRRLHDPWTASGDNHMTTTIVSRLRAHQLGKVSGIVIKMRQRHQPLSPGQFTLEPL